MRQALKKIKAQAGKLLTNEHYTLVLITVGPPAVAYTYLDWRAALAVFMLIQIPLGIINERLSK